MSDAPSPTSSSTAESEHLDGLAAALAKAQGSMRSAKKDSTNPHFKSKYADLAAVWEAIRESLSANGLAVVQRVGTDSDGVSINTMLIHSSGQWMRDVSHFPVAQKTPQGYGSVITYARRYTLCAMVGVAADEDDDGEAASRAPQKSRSDREPENGKRTADVKAQVLEQAKQVAEVAKIGPAQVSTPLQRMAFEWKKAGRPEAELGDFVKSITGKADRRALDDNDVALFVSALEAETKLKAVGFEATGTRKPG